MTFKQKVVRIFFGIEVVVVVGFYVFGSQGIMALMQVKQELEAQQRVVQTLQGDIKNLQYDLDNWTNDPFFVEKHAREKLAMARDGEKIYVVK